jgi:hypothetical protein
MREKHASLEVISAFSLKQKHVFQWKWNAKSIIMKRTTLFQIYYKISYFVFMITN